MRSRIIPWLPMVLLAIALSSAADAGTQPIAAVEVASRVTRDDRDLQVVLRSSVQSQLQRVDWGKNRSGGPFVLSTSLVRLDTRTEAGVTRVSATVSMALREQKRGSLRAIVEGSARFETRPSTTRAAEDDAVVAAVRGAMRNLPEAVRKSK
jgi:hypothetical protein